MACTPAQRERSRPQNAHRPHSADRKDGAPAAKARVKEVLDFGGDGITIPHVTSVDEARLAISFFQDAKANVWQRVKEGFLALLMQGPTADEAIKIGRSAAGR